MGEIFAEYELGKSQPTVEKLRNDLKRKLGKEVKTNQKEDFFSRFDQSIIGSDMSRQIIKDSIQKDHSGVLEVRSAGAYVDSLLVNTGDLLDFF